ncbi:MAG: hypothetical protein AAGI23_06840 [Bacteroidota bacterium]
MNQKLFLRSIPASILLIVGLVFVITLLTTFGETLFVSQNGSFGFSELLAPILAVALVFKWKYARTILGWLYVIAIVGVISIFVVQNHLGTELPVLPYLLLLVLFLVLCYLLFFSKSVKRYVEG